MKKADNIFVKAKAYVKDHPRTSFQDAIQKVKGKSVSGVKKVSGTKKVSGAKVAGVKKRKRITSVKVGSTSVAVRSVAKSDIISRGKAILKQIDKLEAQRKEVNNKDLRDLYSLRINREHKKLRNLKKTA